MYTGLFFYSFLLFLLLFFFISRFSRYKPASGRGVFLMRLFVEGMVSYWVKRGLAVDGLLEDSRKLTEIKKKELGTWWICKFNDGLCCMYNNERTILPKMTCSRASQCICSIPKICVLPPFKPFFHSFIRCEADRHLRTNSPIIY